MKRISTALVAAAVATGLAITPAVAQDAAAPQDGGTTVITETEKEVQHPDGTKETEKTTTTETTTEGKTDPQPTKRGSTTGSAVGATVGILAGLVTAAIIVFSNPKGIDKAIDLLNANFGLGLQKFGF